MWHSLFSIPTFKDTRRFCKCVLSMGLLIAGLFLIEAVALWSIGAKNFRPGSWPRMNVIDLSVSADGRWAASCIGMLRKDIKTSLQRNIVLYDMKVPGHSIVGKLGRFAPQGAAISPDGTRLAFTARDGSVFVARCFQRASPCLIYREPEDVFLRPLWSSDGRWLAAVTSKFICLWHMPGGQLAHKVPHGCHAIPSLHFTSDCRRLLSARDNGALRVWDLTSRETKDILLNDFGSVAGISLSSCGKHVAIVTDESDLYVYDIRSRKEVWRQASTCYGLPLVAFSHDGAFLASVERSIAGTSGISMRSAATGELRCIWEGHHGVILGLLSGADGTLYSWDNKGTIIGWNTDTAQEVWRYSL